MKAFTMVISLLLICGPAGGAGGAKTPPGPRTASFNAGEYARVYHVGSSGSDREGDGSAAHPWASLPHALAQAAPGRPGARVAILVAQGNYPLAELPLREYTDLLGGFDPQTWQRDIFRHRTELDGQGTHRVLIAANHARLDGFVIQNGVIRGKGGAIYCNGVSPEITNNIFRNNRTLAPDNWAPKYRHQIANDGAAIYAENAAAPVIAHNLFVNNNTEVGRGGGIALHSECNGRITGNVFLNNTVGLADPLRSSDGGAVSVFDRSHPLIENNIFQGNRALAANDAGALFVALWAAPHIRQNIFVDNRCDDDAGALFVGGQEHRYDRPLDPIPPREDYFVNIEQNIFLGNANPSRNSGAMRMTMESRGRFVNNVTAFNSGIYFQRSEVAVINNTILDHFLFVETKEGLDLGMIVNNIIWGNFEMDVPTPVRHCNLQVPRPGEGNISAAPLFADDGMTLRPVSAAYLPALFCTQWLISGGEFQPGELSGRVVNAAGRWGVIKSNGSRTIEIWGDFGGIAAATLLPTYHLMPGSPGVNGGAAADAPVVDIDGQKRPAGTGVDIGADEVTGQ